MIKLSDYIIDFLASKGITHAFLVSGGGNIHLIDSVGKGKMQYVCNHHEQASAIAAEGYARYKNDIGLCIVTTGPGATNAITGAASAWLDSIPMVILSGQVKNELIGTAELGMRQLGPQEANIIDTVRPITKYAVLVRKPEEIRYHLEKAFYLAKSGRQGPVWLDIPLDVQAAQIDPKKLKSFEIPKKSQSDKKKLKSLVSETIKKLRTASRPVLYAGNGIRLSGSAEKFLKLATLLKVPILTSYVAYDLLPEKHPYYFGRAHSLGQRSANFIVQNCDLLIAVGARLDVLTTGFTYKAFAREAYKIMVDVDGKELYKPTLEIDLPIQSDAGEFIDEMIKQLKSHPLRGNISPWLKYGKKMIKKYPNIPAQFWNEKKAVNPYCFIDTISDLLNPNDTIVVSNGMGPMNCMYQAFRVKKNQRVILNLGCAEMGYGLPAAIGACFAKGKKPVVCFEGDGSLQLNIHELQVMKHHKLPIKLFVYSNGGYLSIRNTQNALFGGIYVGSDPQSGVSCPDFVKVGKAYGIKSIRIKTHKDMVSKIKKVLSHPGPILCDISAVKELILTPKLQTYKNSSGQFVSPTLENMAPFLSQEEIQENMIIPLWEPQS